MKTSVHLSEQPDPTDANLRIVSINLILETAMNIMNTADLRVRDPLNSNSSVHGHKIKDEGEIIIIEGKHVAVDKNNNRINKSVEYNTPTWLIREYA